MRKAGAFGAFLRNTGVVVVGAVQTCRPVPGALSSWGTEMVFPRIWEYRLAFGVVIEWTSFSFRCRSPSGGEVQNRGPAGPLVWPF